MNSRSRASHSAAAASSSTAKRGKGPRSGRERSGWLPLGHGHASASGLGLAGGAYAFPTTEQRHHRDQRRHRFLQWQRRPTGWHLQHLERCLRPFTVNYGQHPHHLGPLISSSSPCTDEAAERPSAPSWASCAPTPWPLIPGRPRPTPLPASRPRRPMPPVNSAAGATDVRPSRSGRSWIKRGTWGPAHFPLDAPDHGRGVQHAVHQNQGRSGYRDKPVPIM
jgi:hypothetical protein